MLVLSLVLATTTVPVTADAATHTEKAFGKTRINVAGIWVLEACGNVLGATEHTPCCPLEGAQPGDCGTELNGPFCMGDPDIHVTQSGNTIVASEGDVNENPFTLQGRIKGNSVVFTIKGEGINPCLPGSHTTDYYGKIKGATIEGRFSGYGSWSYEDEEGNIKTEHYTWRGKFTVGIIRPPVLLVHGFLGSSRSWNGMKSWLENDGFQVFIIDYHVYPFTDIKTLGEQKLKERIHDILYKSNHGDHDRSNDLPGGITYANSGITKVDIVAHSMGGLISRWYTTSDSYNNDVKRLIMIGTPNHGTVAWGIGDAWKAVRQMRPGSNFLNELNEKPLANDVMHSVLAGTGYKTPTDGIPEITDETDEKTTMKGDKYVTVKSASLEEKGVPLSDVKAKHSLLIRSKDIYEKYVKNFLK